MNPIIIGIDISKQKFDCSFSLDGKSWKHHVFDNNSRGFDVFLQALKKYKICSFHAIMEATGRYGQDLAEFLYAKGYKISVLNPAQIRYYAKSCLTRTKTDKVDARLIAEFALRHETSSWKPLTDEVKKVKSLERCLDIFKNDRTQIINRLEQEKDEEVHQLLEKRREFIDQQIKNLEDSLKNFMKTNKSVEDSIKLLQSIPGIGLTTAFGLLGELPDLSTFNSAKQLSAYAGLNPSIRTSGSSVRGKGSLSKMGSSFLRKLLYFPAMTAMRCNPVLKEFAKRLNEKGKKPMVIIAAVMRKLLHIVFGVLKKQQPFQA
jgi:transposase